MHTTQKPKKKPAPPVPKHITRPFQCTQHVTGALPEQARSLGIVSDKERRLIFDYLMLAAPIERIGEQIVLTTSAHRITVRIDTKVAQSKEWFLEEVENGLHSRTINWLRHAPEDGMSIYIEDIEDDEDGG